MMTGPGNHKSFQGPSAPRCPLLISQLVSGTQQDARLFAITLAITFPVPFGSIPFFFPLCEEEAAACLPSDLLLHHILRTAVPLQDAELGVSVRDLRGSCPRSVACLHSPAWTPLPRA